MNTPDTFLKLIESCRVEIPLLQRDYAQGRSETEDKKAPAVRERFVKELFKALEADGKPLELDFIYGPIRNDEDGNDTFIPLDGQQRLTTLFLLHWYIAKRERQGWYAMKSADQEDSEYKEFTYKVRTTTQEFLNALLNKDVELNLSPKATITDAAWYYSAWDIDPSVQGMLNMLDAIHAEYCEKQAPLWNRLGNIKFQLLDMGEYGLSDDLYMKMNARGVPLTDFENLKSWLTDQCTAVSCDNAYFYTGNDLEKQEQSWNWKIDKEWADYFWSICDSNADKMDAAFLRFFKAVALNAYAEHFPEENIDGKDNKAALYRNNISRLNKDEYVPLAEYSDLFNLTEPETISAAFSMLDILAEENKTGIVKAVPFFRKEEKGSPLIETLKQEMFSYPEQVLFFGMFHYLGGKNTQLGDQEFKEWMRVVRNLVVNSQIDSPQTFVRAIKGLKKLYDAAKDGILDYLAGTPAPEIAFFRDTQVKEEIQKAKLLRSKDANRWIKALQEHEKHPLFEGQIGFLLKASAENFEYPSSDDADLDRFICRAEHAAELWDANGARFDRKEYNHLQFRALIASNCLNLSDREIDLTNSKANWKNLLRGDVLPPAILGLLDCCFVPGKEVLDSLQEVIKLSNPEHNLARYIAGNEKGVPHSPWLYAKCYKNLDDGVLQLRKSKGAWTQNRYYLSQKRDQLLNQVFEILKDERAVFVDRDSGESTNKKPELFLKEWLTVGLVLEHKGGSAYVAYTTDGLTHEIGVRKDRKASPEKFAQITQLVSSRIGSGFEGVNLEPVENWWWYAYGKIEKPEVDKIARQLQAVRGKLTALE